MPNPFRETKFSGTNGDREIVIFPVQLTTSRIGNLTRLILTLAIICDDQKRKVVFRVVNQYAACEKQHANVLTFSSPD